MNLWVLRCLFFFMIASQVGEACCGEAYGNYHAKGVVLDAPKDFSPAQIGQVKLYMLRGDRARRFLTCNRAPNENFAPSFSTQKVS